MREIPCSAALSERRSQRQQLSLSLGIASFAKMDQIMKTRILPIASCLCLLVMLIALLSALLADGADKPTQRKIYDESANGDKQVADAIVIAKREHKHILLQFGANWCSWG